MQVQGGAVAQPRGGALAIDECHPNRYRFQLQAAIRSWQSSSGAPAMGHPDIAAGKPATVSPAYQGASPRPAAFAAPAAQLPPEILVDRHLVRVDRLLADDDYGAALAVMDEIAAGRVNGPNAPEDALRGRTHRPPAPARSSYQGTTNWRLGGMFGSGRVVAK